MKLFKNFYKKCQKVILISSMLVLSEGCQSQNPFKEKKAVIKVAFDQEPTTLDPRLGKDLYTANVLLSIYEGLMRLDYDGHVSFGVAAKVDINPDLTTYTFHLRDAKWSDGSSLTANDFIETWKSVLDPKFPAPNADQLYYIKGAKRYKEGLSSVDELGISAPDDKTLVVQLEKPVPYFLKLVSTYFYLPVHITTRNALNDSVVVSNGPFALKEWKQSEEIILEKNNSYWDAKVVSLDYISMPILEENTALKMFEAGQIDHAGSPTATLPQDAMQTLVKQHILKSKSGAGTHMFRFNTKDAMLGNKKLRRALSLSINRKEIVEHITQGNQKEAFGFVPPLVDWKNTTFYKDNDITTAWRLFQEALIDLKVDKDHFPTLTISYTYSDRNHKIVQAIQQQWKKSLGINVDLRSQEYKVFNDQVSKGNYQIAIGSWYADFSDPISFLEIFDSKTNPANRTNWSDKDYRKLIELSNNEMDTKKRFNYLKQAEGILMENMPIAPLFYASFNYVQSEEIGGVGLTDLGLLDFKYSFIDKIENFNETL